jgi:hypothetical protein
VTSRSTWHFQRHEVWRCGRLPLVLDYAHSIGCRYNPHATLAARSSAPSAYLCVCQACPAGPAPGQFPDNPAVQLSARPLTPAAAQQVRQAGRGSGLHTCSTWRSTG